MELCQALCGLREPSAGRIDVDGTVVSGEGPAAFTDAGVGVISDDRLLWDVIHDFTLADNLALSKVRAGSYSKSGLLSRRAIQRDAEGLLRDYDVRPPDPNALMGRLSGGNQQKVVIARECAAKPKALIASHPTRGLDVGATEFVHRKLVELRDEGCAVLLNSTDLDELLALSDRIVVLYRGRVVMAARADSLDVRQVAEAMTAGRWRVNAAATAPQGSGGGGRPPSALTKAFLGLGRAQRVENGARRGRRDRRRAGAADRLLPDPRRRRPAKPSKGCGRAPSATTSPSARPCW